MSTRTAKPSLYKGNTRPAIAFVINSLTTGGAERALVTLLGGLTNHLSAYDAYLFLLDDASEQHVVPQYVVKKTLNCGGSIFSSTWRLKKELSRLRPEVTVSFINRSNYANVLASLLTGGRSVISQRNHTSKYFPRTTRGLIHRVLVRFLYPKATSTIAVSKGVADDLIANFGLPRSNVSVVHNVNDVGELNRLSFLAPSIAPPREKYIIAIGAMIPVKGFDFLIHSFHAANLPHHLVLLGDGPERPRLTALVDDLGIADRVLMPGHLLNPYPILTRASALVSASYSEGYPNVLVEALALGCPVVSTDCPAGPAEILNGSAQDESPSLGEYGILVRPGDQVSMVEAIKMIIKPDIRTKFSARGPARAEQLGQGAIDNYWAILKEAMRSGDEGADENGSGTLRAG